MKGKIDKTSFGYVISHYTLLGGEPYEDYLEIREEDMAEFMDDIMGGYMDLIAEKKQNLEMERMKKEMLEEIWGEPIKKIAKEAIEDNKRFQKRVKVNIAYCEKCNRGIVVENYRAYINNHFRCRKCGNTRIILFDCNLDLSKTKRHQGYLTKEEIKW